MSTATADPFGTAQLRAATLATWRSSPTRLREDSNLERDYAQGAYRDRLVVELAQNASDAAQSARVPGRLLLRVEADQLIAANVGAPLDRAGVESLSAMRASSKEAGATGRFGVGFAAVLSVTDAPSVCSSGGGVRFDRDETRRLAESEGLPLLPESLDVPALRLPFPTSDPAPTGYDTAVVLPFRDGAARDLALAAVADVDDALLLSLPHLDEVLIEVVHEQGGRRHHWQVSRDADPVVVVQDGTARYWSLTTIAGGVTEAEEEQLPHEEALRRQYCATVAIPVDVDGRPVPSPTERVVHAPTPTDDPLDLPALLIADFPLDASRRRVLECDRAAEVADALAIGYASAVAAAGAAHGPAAAATLIPEPHALTGWVDQAVRDGVRQRLREWPFVTRAGDARPALVADVAALDPAAADLAQTLASWVTDLLDPDWYPHLTLLRGLGLPIRPVSDVWEVAATVGIPADAWPAIYDAVASLGAAATEGIPVPLVDGRVRRGARGAVLAPPVAPEAAEAVTVLGIDCVHPDAAHPLLERLGATSFSAAAVLDDRFVRHVHEAAETDPLAAREMLDAAATLLALDGVATGELPQLGTLPVPVAAGGWQSAVSVVLPGSALDRVAPDEVPRLAPDVQSDPAGWTAIGVLADLVPITVVERPVDPELWQSLAPDGGSWCLAIADLAGVDDPGELMVLEATVVRGVELLEGSGAALRLLSATEVRSWLARPTAVLTGDGRRVDVPSPSAWWLGESPLIEGRCPVDVRLPGDDRLAPFFPLAPELPEGDALLRTLGARTTVEDWLSSAAGVEELLDLLADPEVALSAHELVGLYRVLSEVGEVSDPPEKVRACSGRDTVVVGADAVLVAVAPHHAAVLDPPFIPGTAALARVLDLEVSSDPSCGAGELPGTGTARPVPELPFELPRRYREHDAIEVAGREVDWWVTDDGEVHAATMDGLARGLAWAGRCWSRRFEIALRLEHPEPAQVERLEAYFDG